MLDRIRAIPALQDQDWKRAFIFWLGLALLFHVLAAVFSVGYYHTDEHFQILEFLNYKLGRSAASDLAIEFGAHLRPWFQPGIDYVLTKLMLALGVNSPFQWVFVFRLYSALLGWLSLVGLALLSYEWFDDRRLRKIALMLCALLWYLPALHARHSSESLSGSTFYIGTALLFLFPATETLLFYLLIGLVFGAAFLFRYQVGFLIMGAFFYFAFRYRPSLRKLAMIASGIIVMVLAGVWIDHWGYGVWTFTPWNYFHYNIVLNHVADMDTEPIWDFFRSSFTETFPPLGFVSLCGFFLGWVFEPLHLLTAVTFPLFFIHSIIGHKELRFIFPMVGAGPFLLLLAISARNKAGAYWRKICFSKPGRVAIISLFAINLVALPPTTLLPCWMPARLYEHIYAIKRSRYPKVPLTILFKDKDPFEILGIPMKFYRTEDTKSQKVASFADLNSRIDHSTTGVWFFQVGYFLPNSAGAAQTECRPIAESLPQALASLVRWKPIRRFTHRVTDWTLFRCKRS